MQLGHDRPRPHGRQHDEAPRRARPRHEDVRPAGRVDGEDARGARDQLDAPRTFWMMVPAGKITEDTFQTLLGLARAGRRDRRRRQLELPRLAAPLRRAKAKGHPVRRRRRLRRRLGARERLLPDGRRRRRRGRAGRAGLPRPRARRRLRARRRRGRGALHEDGPQRDRVRPHAGVRRGLRGDARSPSSTSTCTRSPASGATARSCARGCSSCCTPRSRRRAAHLETIRGYVEDSGEGRWTIAEAIAEDVPVPVITAALFARFASRQDESFAAKVNAALRNQFGGHAVKPEQAS